MTLLYCSVNIYKEKLYRSMNMNIETGSAALTPLDSGICLKELYVLCNIFADAIGLLPGF